MIQPILYFTLGTPGSGKTHFSRLLARKARLFHLNSDRVRLEMFEQPTYQPDEHMAVFRVMDFIASELLTIGVSLIYDANLNKKVHRDRVRDLAARHGAVAVLLWLQAPERTALGRISGRGTDADKYFRNITPNIFHHLKNQIEQPLQEPYIAVDGTVPFYQQLRQLAAGKVRLGLADK